MQIEKYRYKKTTQSPLAAEAFRPFLSNMRETGGTGPKRMLVEYPHRPHRGQCGYSYIRESCELVPTEIRSLLPAASDLVGRRGAPPHLILRGKMEVQDCMELLLFCCRT